MLELISAARLNVEHMQNRVFRGGEAAVAVIDVAGRVPGGLLDDIGGLPEVLGASQTSLDGEAT